MPKKGYTTKADIENYLLQTIDSSFDTQLDTWIESAEKYIDKQTGRNFIALSTAAARVFDGNGDVNMRLDDFISISKVENGDGLGNYTEIASTDYLIYPVNEERKNKIKLLYDYFLPGYQNIRITAKWGYSAAVPSDIKLAATILVVGILNFGNDARGKVRSKSVGGFSVSFVEEKGWQDFSQVDKILAGYKKYSF